MKQDYSGVESAPSVSQVLNKRMCAKIVKHADALIDAALQVRAQEFCSFNWEDARDESADGLGSTDMLHLESNVYIKLETGSDVVHLRRFWRHRLTKELLPNKNGFYINLDEFLNLVPLVEALYERMS